MDENKITHLKAHLQWTLGRIDALRWVQSNIKLSTEDSGKVKERVHNLEQSQRETQGKIDTINAEAEKKRQETKDRKEQERLERQKARNY